ncbi:MAG TPA: lysophospholipid acyltransferase family protein [Bacteroidales bacterium]|nr:lysophospholipid acyltransferase family protein [Bacteroidales bacterium]
MKAILYYIFKALNWLITLLPLGLLYFFSPLFYFILYYFPGYRKKIVMNNLRNSFPGKKDIELKIISKKFYRHLADLFIEVLKLQHMSSRSIKKRYKVLNPELLDNLKKEGKSTIAVFGHYANWEWIISLPLSLDYKCITVYKPLANKYFDRYFKKFRSQYGLELITMTQTGRTVFRYEKGGINTLLGLVADQTPPNGEIQYWTRFLNQETPVYLGIEKLSHKFNMAVVFFNIDKVKRGYYELYAELISENPVELEPYAVTELHVRKLEEQIRRRPELWMWSHRRWKHKKPDSHD